MPRIKKLKPVKNAVISKMIKDSRRPTVVHRKTEGIRNTAKISFQEFLTLDLILTCIPNRRYKLAVVSNIDKIRIARKSGAPRI
jgi:hypothetical protein